MIPITTRAEWGAEHGTGSPDPGPEPRVVIHHSYRPALEADATEDQEVGAVKGIESYHVNNNKWAGIGYNFLVAPSGRVYEGRGWKFRGAHAGPVNGESIGICLLIDGRVQVPTPEMVVAVRDLIRQGVEAGEIDPDFELSGHRDHMARECPGDLVYEMLEQFRSRDVPQFPTSVVDLVDSTSPFLYHELPTQVEQLRAVLKEPAVTFVAKFARDGESMGDLLCRLLVRFVDWLPWYMRGVVRSALEKFLGCALNPSG